MTQANERFTALVMRELQAVEVQIVDSGEPERDSEHVLSARLQDGRRVDAVFDRVIEDRAALARRLQMLVAAFESALELALWNSGRLSRVHAMQTEPQEQTCPE